MARPKQDGLLYFPFDTDFFYADKRMKRVKARLGNNGLLFYIYLLTEIYRNGYYVRWDEESVDDAVDDLNLTEGFIEQAMICLTARKLITKIEIVDSGQNETAVITSPGIQKRYQEAVKGRKRQFYVDSRIWLLSEDETESCIKVTHNVDISKKNESNSGKNNNKSVKNAIKEIKEKEINNIYSSDPHEQVSDEEQPKHEYCPSDFERKCVDFLIQSILNDLPNQKVPRTDKEIAKWAIHIDRLHRIDGISEADIWNTLVWTMKDAFWRTNIRSTGKFREKYQTLYLQSKRGNRDPNKNRFNDFEQNKYDFETLEKELIQN